MDFMKNFIKELLWKIQITLVFKKEYNKCSKINEYNFKLTYLE